MENRKNLENKLEPLEDKTLCPLRLNQPDPHCIKKECEWYLPAFKSCATTFIATVLFAENQNLRLEFSKPETNEE